MAKTQAATDRTDAQYDVVVVGDVHLAIMATLRIGQEDTPSAYALKK
ncbi:hypothetical protein [Streptomyces sp. NPDC048473]